MDLNDLEAKALADFRKLYYRGSAAFQAEINKLVADERTILAKYPLTWSAAMLATGFMTCWLLVH